MIDNIIQLLQMYEHYNGSELVQVAKGKYSLPMSIKEKRKNIKRWQLKKR